jgi:hypothetical protein
MTLLTALGIDISSLHTGSKPEGRKTSLWQKYMIQFYIFEASLSKNGCLPLRNW